MCGENLYCNFGQKKIVKLYIRVLFYQTIIPKGLFELFFIEKTHAIKYVNNRKNRLKTLDFIKL